LTGAVTDASELCCACTTVEYGFSRAANYLSHSLGVDACLLIDQAHRVPGVARVIDCGETRSAHAVPRCCGSQNCWRTINFDSGSMENSCLTAASDCLLSRAVRRLLTLERAKCSRLRTAPLYLPGVCHFICRGVRDRKHPLAQECVASTIKLGEVPARLA